MLVFVVCVFLWWFECCGVGLCVGMGCGGGGGGGGEWGEKNTAECSQQGPHIVAGVMI